MHLLSVDEAKKIHASSEFTRQLVNVIVLFAILSLVLEIGLAIFVTGVVTILSTLFQYFLTPNPYEKFE